MDFSTVNCASCNQQPYIDNIIFKLNKNFFFYLDLNNIFF